MVIQTLSRRKLLGGLGLLIAAPAIVKASSLMPVKAYADGGPMELTEADVYGLLKEILRTRQKYVSDNVVWLHPDEYRSMQDSITVALAAQDLHAGQPVVLR